METESSDAPTFGIGRSVGFQATNFPTDVSTTKRALPWAGYYPPERTQEPSPEATLDSDPQFLLGIRRFQNDFGLTMDSVPRPGGETERALDRHIAPMIRAHGLATPRPGSRTDTPRITPVGDFGPDRGEWREPAAWAIGQAGRDILGVVGGNADGGGEDLLEGTANAAATVQHGQDMQNDETGVERQNDPLMRNLDQLQVVEDRARLNQVGPITTQFPANGRNRLEYWELPEDRWIRPDSAPMSLVEGEEAEFETNAPVRITRRGGGGVVDGFFYYVHWLPKDENGNIDRDTQSNQPPLPRGGHIWMSKVVNDYFEPPYHNPHGWEVRVEFPRQPAVNGATVGDEIIVSTLDGR